ncbi:MAG: ParB/RepB/Spo0J family partition protein, partial [Steroidobacteraceae bacterium]
MIQKKSSLGRGLEALMGPAAGRSALAAADHSGQAADELAKLPLDRLQRGRYQPRVDLRPESLEE